jgi:hypothetical protein
MGGGRFEYEVRACVELVPMALEEQDEAPAKTLAY